MASAKTLATHTRKELAQMAKHNKVDGWHSMKKAELINALKDRRLVKAPAQNRFTERSRSLRQAQDSGPAALRPSKAEANRPKNPPPQNARPPRLSANAAPGAADQLTLSPMGSHWIEAGWVLTQEILERAEASLGKDWHLAAPVLKVFQRNSGEGDNPTKACVDTIALHAGADHWFVPVADPKPTYELQIGYETPKGRFFGLARSETVKMPRPGSPRSRKYEEERKSVSASASSATTRRFPVQGAAGFRSTDDVVLHVDADLCLTGSATPGVALTCQEEPVPVEADGSFEVRLALAEGRQVIPLEAVSADGCQSRTVIVAIERNTKTLDPQALTEWD